MSKLSKTHRDKWQVIVLRDWVRRVLFPVMLRMTVEDDCCPAVALSGISPWSFLS